jgi:hypothetical protein
MIKAKFSNATKEKIYERDNKCCIICWSNTNLQFHHIYFWIEANRWPDRNTAKEWVTICDLDHLQWHWCKSWTWIRQKCIDYINNLYKNE